MPNFSNLAMTDWLNLVSASLEILGAILMANYYLGASHRRHWPLVLLSAVWRGSYAKGAADARDLNQDDGVLVLQGLALIGLGFLLRFSGSVAAALGSSAMISSPIGPAPHR